MKIIVKILHRIFPLLVLLLAMGFCACQNRSKKSVQKKCVVVMHSWSNEGEEGELFSKCMEKEFQSYDMDVEIHHIYANMVRRPDTLFTEYDWPVYADSIYRWNPDIILLNDDPIVDWVLSHREIDSVFVTTPCVFAGVNTLVKDSLVNFPKMTGFEAVIDWERNIDMVRRCGDKQAVAFELDYNTADHKLRSQLHNALMDSLRFVNNYDFHLEEYSSELLKNKFAGQMIVSTISCATPYKNKVEGESDSIAKARTWNIIQNADMMDYLQVKYDIWSNTLIRRSGRPQFTAIREQFNNPSDLLFLGGYFTSTETQVEDQVNYAVHILNGTDPRALPKGMHACDYYMDWNAMQLMRPKMSYAMYSGKYNIVNAPSYLSSPVSFTIWVGLFVLVVSGLVYGIVYFMGRWKKKGQMKLIDELQYEEKVFDLVFSNAKDTLWTFCDDVFTVSERFATYFCLPSRHISVDGLIGMVHEDSKDSLQFLLNFREQRGRKTIRLHLTPDNGKNWYWGKVMYLASDDTAATGELYGLLLNIDDKKKVEDQLEQAQILASQVALKENFLANISHDLRTPLGAVTGFSSLLTMPGMVFEEGERESYGEIIHQNTDMILSMIDSVMKKAQVETGNLEIIQKPVSLCKLVNDCYNTNRIIAPSHLQFDLVMSEPDVIVNIDMTRTKQVINNFLSNAFKFTTEGGITLGWSYIDEPNGVVEVYVQDTGIGVAEEKKNKLFERYSKVTENDKGTGLGLNISKTIIEKQGGTIGVESELGRGSKFFFRLTRFVQCLALFLTLGLGLIMPASCTKKEAKDVRGAKVLVYHGYKREYSSYQQFDDVLLQEFINNDINADVRNVYLSRVNPDASTKHIHQQMRDSLLDKGWTPDVILIEGDRAAVDFLNVQNSGYLPELENIPIVFGGIHHPEWSKMREGKNMVVISDPIEYCANIKLAVEMTGKNIVDIELDYFHQDSLLRVELADAINRPPFVDNSDYHLSMSDILRNSNEYRDSIIVLIHSVESPERNAAKLMDQEESYKYLEMLYINSWRYPALVIKRDLFAPAIVNRTGRPQFSAVKAGFADGTGKYLCGYFSSYETVATDMARMGARILQGTDITKLPELKHEQKFYMDYVAMQRLGLEYKDYCNRFVIVGAPKEVTMPILGYLAWGLITFVFLVAAFCVVLVVHTWNGRTMHSLIENVKRRSEMRNLALYGSDSYTVRSEQRIKDIISCVHPDFANEVPLMMQSVDIEGTHKYEVYADIDGEGKYRWWQLRFVVMYDDKSHDKGAYKHVDGILINIDETKKYEEELRLAMNLAEEARQKEDFMTTISHEIRTPLNAVVGFSDVLVSMPQDAFSEEELHEYDKIIKTNNANLTAMIENILMFSRIESGRIQYVKEEFNVLDLIQELAGEWREIVPDGVIFETLAMRRDVYIYNDRMRMKYILGQLLSNAFKFTTSGSIAMGMYYSLKNDVATIFVTDSGCGLSKEKVDVVYDIFWKDDGFTPGLGLGLAVAHKLADGMDVRLRFESKKGFGSNVAIISKACLKKPEEIAKSE